MFVVSHIKEDKHMNSSTVNKKQLYDQKIRSLFTQVICETESLYQKVLMMQSPTLEQASLRLASLQQAEQSS